MIAIIYESVKSAIRDAVPGAIREALGWRLSRWEETKVVKRKVRTGKYIATPVPAKAEILTDHSIPTLAPEPNMEPEFIIEEKIMKITHNDYVRFNPVTGDYDVRKDKSPMIEFFDKK